MKTTFLAFLTLILFAACSTEEDVTFETNELLEVTNLTATVDDNSEGKTLTEPECYFIQFHFSYSPKSISQIIESGVAQYIDPNYEWVLSSHQPDFYPYVQTWCKGNPAEPDGEQSENDPPIGVIITPIGGHGG